MVGIPEVGLVSPSRRRARAPAERRRPRRNDWTIVCGVDDGHESQEAVQVAVRLCERLGARLVLVLVAAEPHRAGAVGLPASTQEGLHREEIARASERLSELAGDSRRGIAVERRIAFGAPAGALVGVARAERADLVVVGSRGRHGMTSALLGSVSTELARSAPCPVVVVGPGTSVAE